MEKREAGRKLYYLAYILAIVIALAALNYLRVCAVDGLLAAEYSACLVAALYGAFHVVCAAIDKTEKRPTPRVINATHYAFLAMLVIRVVAVLVALLLATTGFASLDTAHLPPLEPLLYLTMMTALSFFLGTLVALYVVEDRLQI